MGARADFILDVKTRRGILGGGSNPHRFIELYGGTEVPLASEEPDALTFRSEYYYDTTLNRLFKKIRRDDGFMFWKGVSEFDAPG
jgi:hypothetical protein